jgi:hypothetical protein
VLGEPHRIRLGEEAVQPFVLAQRAVDRREGWRKIEPYLAAEA